MLRPQNNTLFTFNGQRIHAIDNYYVLYECILNILLAKWRTLKKIMLFRIPVTLDNYCVTATICRVNVGKSTFEDSHHLIGKIDDKQLPTKYPKSS